MVDRPGFSHYTWQNDSDHTITMTVKGEFDNEKILSGECITKTLIGFIEPPSLWDYLRHGMKITFDDGTYGGVFPLSDNRTAPYDVSWEGNYKQGELYEIKECLHRDWTYTFTNADYEAAVARGPMAE